MVSIYYQSVLHGCTFSPLTTDN